MTNPEVSDVVRHDSALPVGVRLVDLRARPTDVPMLARWLKAALSPNRPHVTVDVIEARLRTVPEVGAHLPLTWVAVAGDEPVGCARFVAADHADRPDLTPWLASVYVTPPWRGQGIASALVTTVQAHAAGAGFDRLFLFTPDQARLYRRFGFVTIGTVIFADDGRVSDLMEWQSSPQP